jgi:hypothetical protein
VTANCDNDAVAIDHAKAIQNGLDLEVWEGPRQVAALKLGERV